MKVELSDAFDLQMGKTPSRNDRNCWGKGHKWISISDIGNAGKYIDTTKEEITDIGVSKSGIKVVPKGTVIMSFKLSIGKTAITAEDMYTNEAIMAFIDTGRYEINTDYLYHMCKGINWFEGTNKAVLGLTLNKATMSEKEIEIPPLEVQLQVVSVLDKMDELIALRKEQLAKLDQLVKSRFIELFGEVETLTHRWNVKSFADVTINLDSTRKPVKDADRQKMQGEYPYYGATGIVDYVNDYRIDGTFLLISEDGKALEFRNKDIAFIASGKIWVNNHAHVLRCTEDIQMVFLKYYMNFRNISDWVTGIDQKKLNRANMDKIPVGLPPIGLQKQFSTFVEQTDKTKLTIQQSLEKLELLKKSLMQEYFG